MENKEWPRLQTAIRDYRAVGLNATTLLEIIICRLVKIVSNDGLSATARRIGISAQYLHDVIHHKRPVSENFLDKIEETAGDGL